MDKELITALQCRIRVLEGTAGGYRRDEIAMAELKLLHSDLYGLDKEQLIERLEEELQKA